jgi:cobalt-zinc-cadmium efflux system membrane fusion protein
MNTEERNTPAGRIGRKQWMAIVAVLVAGIAAGALILRTAPAKPETPGHSEAAEHAEGEHHDEEGKGDEKGHDHDRDHAHGHASGEAGHEEKKGEHKEQESEHKEERKEQERKIAFTDAQIEAAGVAVESAGPARIKSLLQLPGEIRFNEDRTAHVVPRVGGVVESVSANLGQEVKRGQVLAVLSSPMLSEQRSELQTAQRRLELARATYQREKKLWEEKISAQQDYLQAQQAMQEAQIAVANANQKLLALGATPASSALGRYELRAPFDGMVVEKHISLGEAVKEDASVFTISDLSSVWAEISVAANHLNMVRIGEPATIRSSAFAQSASGTVSYVGSLIGAQTRAATARVTLANPQRVWRPGLFVNVELVSSEANAPVTVSAEAVQTVEDKPTVFLRVPGGFVPQHVQTGRSDGQRIEIVGGLAPGAAHAARGSFVVKSQQGKSSATHTH